jgi:hypothetical protein
MTSHRARPTGVTRANSLLVFRSELHINAPLARF